MELEKIHNIGDLISIPLNQFYPSFEESYLYDLVKKYQDKVVAWENDYKHGTCTILLRGKIKYFMIVFELDDNRMQRIYDDDMGQTFSDQVLITNSKEFERYQKVLIINSLEDTNENNIAY